MTTIIISLASCRAFGQKHKCYDSQADTIKFTKVSLEDLKANLTKYSGQWIEIEGIYYGGFEYSTIAPIQKLNSKTKLASFWINFDKKTNCIHNLNKFNGTKVLLRGKINLDKHGHLSNYEATIDDIYYIKEL